MPTYLWGEERVLEDQSTSEFYEYPAVTKLSNGNQVVIWVAPGTPTNVVGQLLDPAGNPIGGVFAVGDGTDPSVTALSNGGFAVSWTGFADAANSDIYARVFDAAGTPGSQISVDATLVDDAALSRITAVGSEFWVAWTESSSTDGGNIFAQRYSSAGAPVGGQIAVNDVVTGSQTLPNVQRLENGLVVVTWTDGSALYGRVFSSSGTAAGAQFTLSTDMIPAFETFPAKILPVSGGNFAVIWTADTGSAFDTSNYHIRLQYFDSTGAALTSPVLVNSTTSGYQFAPDAVRLPDGRILVAWASSSTDGSYDIKGHLLSADGQKIGGEFQINSTTVGSQILPQLTVLADGRVSVVYRTPDGPVHLQIIDPRDGQIGGGPGADTMYGGHISNDQMQGFAGADVLYGYGGNDQLIGSEGDDQLWGGFGDDVEWGGIGADGMNGEAGTDFLSGGAGNDFITGGVGDDQIYGDNDHDQLYGEDGADFMLGGFGADSMFGGAGNDSMDGGYDSDVLSGEAGADLMFGGGQNDTMYGGDGADYVAGGTEDDLLSGGGDADQLFGEAGNDTLYGDNGDDRINGGLGGDTLYGGPGNDRFIYASLLDSAPGSSDLIADYGAGDLIDVSAIDANTATPGDEDFVWVNFFTASAGQAVLFFDGGTNTTRLWLDQNGDGAADFALAMTGNVDRSAFVGIYSLSAPVGGEAEAAPLPGMIDAGPAAAGDWLL